VSRITAMAPVTYGIMLGAGSLDLSESTLQNLYAVPLFLNGPATVKTVLITTGRMAAITIGASGSLSLAHPTVVAHLALRIDNSGQRPVSVAHSIIYGNQGGDLFGVDCGSVAWSDVGSVDCSGAGNKHVDPQFNGFGDWRLMATSPLLDFGPDPSNFTGVPC